MGEQSSYCESKYFSSKKIKYLALKSTKRLKKWVNFVYAVYSRQSILLPKPLYVMLKVQPSPTSDDGLQKKRPTVHLVRSGSCNLSGGGSISKPSQTPLRKLATASVFSPLTVIRRQGKVQSVKLFKAWCGGSPRGHFAAAAHWAENGVP